VIQAANGSFLFTLESITLAFDVYFPFSSGAYNLAELSNQALLDTLHCLLAQCTVREAAFYASASGCDFQQSRCYLLGPVHFTSDGWAPESSDTFQEDYGDLPDLIEYDI
jgi:hypothetical protein